MTLPSDGAAGDIWWRRRELCRPLCPSCTGQWTAKFKFQCFSSSYTSYNFELWFSCHFLRTRVTGTHFLYSVLFFLFLHIHMVWELFSHVYYYCYFFTLITVIISIIIVMTAFIILLSNHIHHFFFFGITYIIVISIRIYLYLLFLIRYSQIYVFIALVSLFLSLSLRTCKSSFLVCLSYTHVIIFSKKLRNKFSWFPYFFIVITCAS